MVPIRPVWTLFISADIQSFHQRLPCKLRVTSQHGDPRNTYCASKYTNVAPMQMGHCTVNDTVGASIKTGMRHLHPLAAHYLDLIPLGGWHVSAMLRPSKLAAGNR